MRRRTVSGKMQDYKYYINVRLAWVSVFPLNVGEGLPPPIVIFAGKVSLKHAMFF